MTYPITGDLLVGHDILLRGNRSLSAVDPSSGVTLEPAFALATLDDVEHACNLAAAALDEYRAIDLQKRALFLEQIATNIAAIRCDLLERATAESGLPGYRLEGEFNRTVNQLRLFARVVRDAEWLDLRVDPELPDRTPLPRPDIRLRQIPLGPVAVFGSSNFPLAFSVAGGDTASALAAGCPVVVKGHLAHPGTSELVGRAVQSAVKECGMPPGTFSLLPGANDIGAAIVRHPAIKAVGFTGSSGGGMALVSIASSRPEPIPVYAEMSSVNPVFLFPGALSRRAEAMAEDFVVSLTVGAGQLCTNPGVLIATAGDELDRFVDKVVDGVSLHKPGPMLTSGIHEAYDKGVERFSTHTGVTTLAKSLMPEGVNRSHAVFFETSAAEFSADPILAEEVFGASSLLVKCADIAEMQVVAETLRGQLTATLHISGEDFEQAGALIPILERKAGRILVNGWPTGVEVSDSMVHGGPFPATSDSRATSVGTMAIRRFLRPVSYQNIPEELLPRELRQKTLAHLPHLRDGVRHPGKHHRP